MRITQAIAAEIIAFAIRDEANDAVELAERVSKRLGYELTVRQAGILFDRAMNEEAEDKMSNALQVLILTPHIHAHLKQHDPKALEQAVTALRETLDDEDREEFEERLARKESEGGSTKNLVPRVHIYLPKPDWSMTTLDGQTVLQVLMEGPATPYLSRS